LSLMTRLHLTSEEEPPFRHIDCCDARADGGFMPQLFDSVPMPASSPLRCAGGTRMMRFGPSHQTDIKPDTSPNGGLTAAKKILYHRSDRPWASGAKPKLFSQPPYVGDGEPIRNKANPNSKLAPLRTGKAREPYSKYPHSHGMPLKPEPDFAGRNLKTGRAPDYFDTSCCTGPQMVSESRPRMKSRPTGRMITNMRRKDTFGDHPEHSPDPHKDNPLGGDPCVLKRPFCRPCPPISKPCIPIVNVWDHPACLQTKAGVCVGYSRVTGERTTYLSDKGRLETTI
jgi:hypothetical protein